MISSFNQLERLALDNLRDPLLIACVEPHNPALLRALKQAVDHDLVKPVLIGDEQRINIAAKQAEVDFKGWELVRSAEPGESIYTALDLARNDKIGALLKGVFGARDFLSYALERTVGFRIGKSRVSGLMACKVEQLERMLFIADPVVTPHPKLMDLVAILNNTVTFTRKVGYDLPKAALLAAVEVIYPQMPATMTEAVIAKMADKGQIKGCLVDGPLSMDVALIESAAREKGAPGKVVGHADILIGHNLAVSYGVYKAFAMYTKSEYGLVTLGGKVPAVIVSDFDDEQVKYNSLLLAVISAFM